jgi:hypothetical protein
MSGILQRLNAQAREEYLESIRYIKTCAYQGTAFKMEMEAQTGREGSDYCEECNGDGYWYNEETDDRIDCDYCDGTGRYEYNGDWTDAACKQFILENVPKVVRDALIFIKVYYDGSVDTECTATLPIDKAHYAVYLLEAFKKLCQAIGGMDTRGAGMHLAILNDRLGRYGGNGSANHIDPDMKANFKSAMTPLLPALYFLASPGSASRGLGYRAPKVGSYGKDAAIAHNGGVFEYRVFETCYDRPMAILDDIIVIANTLKFYKNEAAYTKANIGKFGFAAHGTKLERFYVTMTHIQALKHGLKYLAPKYLSFEQLCAARGLEISESQLIEKEAKLKEEWKAEFEDVKLRRRYERLALYHKNLSRTIEELRDMEQARKLAKTYTERDVESRGLKGGVQQFLKSKYDQYANPSTDYVLEV